MSGVLHEWPEWRRPIGAIDYDLSDTRARELDSLIGAVYDLLSTPMDRATLLAEVHDEWGACTEEDLKTALRLLRRTGHVRRRGGTYALARSF